MEIFLMILPLIISLLFLIANKKNALHALNIFGASVLLFIFVFVSLGVVTNGKISYPGLESFFYIDSFSLIVLDIILLIGSMVCFYSIGYLNREFEHGKIDLKRMKIYYCLTYVFIFVMELVVTTQNMGIMWIAIEATTLASVFLVGFYNNKHSIEAAWKYIIICSVGIALAFLGIIFLYFSSAKSLHDAASGLNWSFLYGNAQMLDPGILKIAFIFVFVGFGTKVGLSPMHTWLPDAHSQAPAPISALLSGVLLNSAMYGIMRMTAVVNKNLGNSTYTGSLLIAFGLLSIVTAAIFILSQKDYKRLLAYSSIEHMGIISFAFGIFTPAAIFGALFHMVNHAFTKSTLFLSSGNVYLKYNSKEISKVSGLLRVMPYTGIVFLLGIFAIAGMPPFSVFSSELSIIISSFGMGYVVLGAVFILLLSIVFAGMVSSMFKMFFGQVRNKDVARGEINWGGTLVIILLFVVIFVMGIYMPAPLESLFKSASGILAGGQ